MAVFRVRLSHSPGTAPVQTGGGAGHAQERKHKVDHRVLSTNPKPIKLPNYTHEPRREPAPATNLADMR